MKNLGGLGRQKTWLLSPADGKTTLHALGSLEARGTLFCPPATEVYAGMLIGECARESDLEVNPVREKKLTNVRAANNDEKVTAAPAETPFVFPHLCLRFFPLC